MTAQEAVEKWCDQYSSPGDFEESGQQEAFHAGWKAGYVQAIEDAANRALQLTDKMSGWGIAQEIRALARGKD